MATELWRRAERFHQVGIVVDDLEKAMGSMSAALGCPEDGWTVFAAAEPFEHVEDGVTIAARGTRYAHATSGATVYQLLEPVEGDTVWQRWLDAGVSTFAVGYYVRDLADAEAGLVAERRPAAGLGPGPGGRPAVRVLLRAAGGLRALSSS